MDAFFDTGDHISSGTATKCRDLYQYFDVGEARFRVVITLARWNVPTN
jgi:hypothetical protein